MDIPVPTSLGSTVGSGSFPRDAEGKSQWLLVWGQTPFALLPGYGKGLLRQQACACQGHCSGTHQAGWAAVCRLSLTLRQIQEALTPGHLKKAKLMFFFTRYPSSTLLKTYFLDVQVKQQHPVLVARQGSCAAWHPARIAGEP